MWCKLNWNLFKIQSVSSHILPTENLDKIFSTVSVWKRLFMKPTHVEKKLWTIQFDIPNVLEWLYGWHTTVEAVINFFFSTAYRIFVPAYLHSSPSALAWYSASSLPPVSSYPWQLSVFPDVSPVWKTCTVCPNYIYFLTLNRWNYPVTFSWF